VTDPVGHAAIAGEAQVPLARMGETAEVAAAVLWLLSHDASYRTGATLNVTGGL
jgi:NAD(P)-dependent dehydrogenase (short-subunit alcohol dehydrogenase family)